MYRRKTWQEKLGDFQPPKIVAMPPKMRKRLGTGTLLIPCPREVDALIRTVGSGRLITFNQIRQKLAATHGATTTCPMATGIFVWIAAHAAEEAARAGKSRITPYWRVVKQDGSLNPKFPGGVAAQARKLRAEGHRIDTSRRIPRVAFATAGK